MTFARQQFCKWCYRCFVIIALALVFMGGKMAYRRLWPRGLECDLSASNDTIRCFAFGPGSQLAASAGDRGDAYIWDLATRKRRQTLRGHSAPIIDVAWSSDGSVLATASTDGNVRVWNVGSGTERIVRSEALRAHINAIAFIPNTETLAVGANDGSVATWDTSSGEWRILGKELFEVTDVAVTSTGDVLASRTRDGHAQLWSLGGGKQIHDVLVPLGFDFGRVVFSTNGRQFGCNASGQAHLRDTATGTLQHVYRAPVFEAMTAVAISPDDKFVSATNIFGSVVLWDKESREIVARFRTGGEVGVCFSADAKRFCTFGSNGTCRVFKVTAVVGR